MVSCLCSTQISLVANSCALFKASSHPSFPLEEQLSAGRPSFPIQLGSPVDPAHLIKPLMISEVVLVLGPGDTSAFHGGATSPCSNTPDSHRLIIKPSGTFHGWTGAVVQLDCGDFGFGGLGEPPASLTAQPTSAQRRRVN